MRPVTRFTYDNLGNITKVEAGYTLTLSGAAGADVLKVQYSYTYDDFGRKLTETDGLNKTWSYVYDANNNVTQITDPKGQILTFDYYYGGLTKTQKVYLSSTDANPAVTTYIRNDLGQITSVSSPAVTYTYSFDPTTNRLASVTDTRAGGTRVKTLSYAYTKAGRIKRVQTAAPGNPDYRRTDYLRDPTGRLAGIWAPNDDLVTFVYDQGGRLTEKWLAVSSSSFNSLKTRYAWNADNTLSTLRNLSSNDFEFTKNEYVYNDVAQRVANLEVSNGLAAGAVRAAYQYDWLNNRVVATDLAGTNTYYYTFDDANQLTSVRTGSETGTLVKAFIYDANGNMIQKCEDGTITVSANSCTGTTVTSMSYDPLNRLTGVTKTGFSAQTYTYDDQGRRIAKTVGAATTYYVYDGDNIAAEYGSNWTTAAAIYTHGPNTDQPLFRSAGGATKYYHQDGLGSVVAVTLNGIPAGQLFDAWGNVIKANQNSASPIPQYGYTGREPDETGLIYYRARYYDPQIGRFLQRDPIGFAGGLNMYAYVSNNPVNKVDPTGTVDLVYGPNNPLPGVANTDIPGVRYWVQDHDGKVFRAGTPPHHDFFTDIVQPRGTVGIIEGLHAETLAQPSYAFQNADLFGHLLIGIWFIHNSMAGERFDFKTHDQNRSVNLDPYKMYVINGQAQTYDNVGNVAWAGVADSYGFSNAEAVAGSHAQYMYSRRTIGPDDDRDISAINSWYDGSYLNWARDVKGSAYGANADSQLWNSAFDPIGPFSTDFSSNPAVQDIK